MWFVNGCDMILEKSDEENAVYYIRLLSDIKKRIQSGNRFMLRNSDSVKDTDGYLRRYGIVWLYEIGLRQLLRHVVVGPTPSLFTLYVVGS